MTFNVQKAALVAACAAVAATSANAAILNLRYSTAGGAQVSGKLGGTAFSTTNFQLDLQVDTAPWVSGASAWAPASSATVTIGSNTYQITTALQCYLISNGATGVSRMSGSDLFSFNSPSLASWDKQSAVGPVVNLTGGRILQWQTVSISTNAGLLNMNDQSGFGASFTASAVPAPGAVALLGVAGLAGRRRRR